MKRYSSIMTIRSSLNTAERAIGMAAYKTYHCKIFNIIYQYWRTNTLMSACFIDIDRLVIRIWVNSIQVKNATYRVGFNSKSVEFFYVTGDWLCAVVWYKKYFLSLTIIIGLVKIIFFISYRMLVYEDELQLESIL